MRRVSCYVGRGVRGVVYEGCVMEELMLVICRSQVIC